MHRILTSSYTKNALLYEDFCDTFWAERLYDHSRTIESLDGNV